MEHACSHRVDHDLSNRPADKRAGFARWLASKDCTDCWKAARDADSASKEKWLAEKRAEELEAAATWAKQFDMPQLEGPAKALDWGERSRHQLMMAAHTALVVEGSWDAADWAELEEKARSISGVGRGRVTGVSTSPFPSAARPNRTCESPRIRLSTSPASADAGLRS
ncbi:hypothetical protein [Streptomyces lancefieldiae]|uniref:Uncharacterized protein n=1 Tax=Streptomyces lancefieldiae TaxID=3075520 RepID=A0ABU3AZD4_9ACTN|nr:hypothetical protein [Streptomyces sp. DSM 40712]MDT0615549.1 hypothetical protein [Streptomyces sp. DSM 40712]